MIQRVQSIFLVLIATVLFFNLILPFWESKSVEISTGISGLVEATPFALQFIPHGQGAVINKGNTYYIAAIALVAIFIALFTLFQYKSRKLQIRLCLINYMFIGGIIAGYFLAIDQAKEIFQGDGNYAVGFFAPLLAIVFNFFAIRFIKKDEELVRSVDRIR